MGENKQSLGDVMATKRKKIKHIRAAKSRLKYKIKRLRRPLRLKERMSLKEWVIFICVVLVVGAAGYMFISSGRLVESGDIFALLSELFTTDYKMVELDVAFDKTQGVITLTSECKRITAYVEPHQAESIYRGINEIFVARPNAHDVTVDAFESLGIDVIMTKVTEIRDNAFYGRLILKKGNKVVSLDVRPSDATAIAVRVGAPIYVKNELLETYGEDIC